MKLEQYLKNVGLSIKDAESIFGEVVTEYIKCCSEETQDIAVSNNIEEITKALISMMNSKEGREEIQKYAKKRNITLASEGTSQPIDLDFDPEVEEWEEIEEEDYIPEDLYEDMEEIEEVEDETESLNNKEKEEEESEVEEEIEVDEDLEELIKETDLLKEKEQEEKPEEEVEVEEVETEAEVEDVEPEAEVEEVEPEAEVEEVEPEPEAEEVEPVVEPEVEEESEESDFYMAEIPIAEIRKDKTEINMKSISQSLRMWNQNFIAREKNVNTYIFQFGKKELVAYLEYNTTTNEAVIYGDKKSFVDFAALLLGDEVEIKPAGDIKDNWEEEIKAFKQVVRYNYMPINQAVIEPRLIDNLLNMSMSNIIYMLRLHTFMIKGNREIKAVNCVPKDYPKYLWGNYGLKVNEDFDVPKTQLIENELIELGLIKLEDDTPILTGNGFMLLGFIMQYIFPNDTTKFGNIYYEPDLLYTYGNTYVSVSDDTTLYGNEAFMEIGGNHLDFYPIFNSKQTSKEMASENENSAYYQKKYMDALNNLFNKEDRYSERGYKFPFVGGGLDKETHLIEYKGNTIGTTIFSLESQLYSVSVDTALINYFKKYYLSDGGNITLIKITDMEADSLLGVVKTLEKEQIIIGLIKANGVNERTNPCWSLPDGKSPDFVALYSQNTWIEEYESLTKLNSYKDVAAEIGIGQEITDTDEVAEEILDRALSPETDLKGMLERKIKSRKLLLEDMKEEGEEKSTINKLSFKIEIYQEQLEELNN